MRKLVELEMACIRVGGLMTVGLVIQSDRHSNDIS
ncbi:unannotated protein [freshwater metagenome]|uniref:Unannotated protein n=1 Tax=freshwater metagenome TaxID=449393 RepID=A0A6J5YGC1_9ZZZZ